MISLSYEYTGRSGSRARMFFLSKSKNTVTSPTLKILLTDLYYYILLNLILSTLYTVGLFNPWQLPTVVFKT